MTGQSLFRESTRSVGIRKEAPTLFFRSAILTYTAVSMIVGILHDSLGRSCLKEILTLLGLHRFALDDP